MRKRLFSKTETYYKSTVLLAGSTEPFYLEPGEYMLPFQIDLPHRVPSSFEHELGRIRHYLLASLEIPV